VTGEGQRATALAQQAVPCACTGLQLPPRPSLSVLRDWIPPWEKPKDFDLLVGGAAAVCFFESWGGPEAN
jgi:hypothetical protein